MPRVSNRQDTLKWVRQNLYFSILVESSDSDDCKLGPNDMSSSESSGIFSSPMSGSDLELDSSSDSEAGLVHDPIAVHERPSTWIELHAILESERFWSERTKRFQAKQFSETFFYEVIPDHLFRQMTRMGKCAFQKLVRTIENHSIFQNRLLNPQAPIALQLGVCLDRMGHSGNGSCLKHTLLLWGISMGTTVNYTHRCIAALQDSLQDILSWPDAERRHRISEGFAMKGFPGCVGLIDGTTIPLAQKPHHHGEVYYERKCRYSIKAQVVCDNNRKITFIYTGSLGSCSDLTCLRRSELWDRIHGQSVFDQGHDILGDSGYVNAPHMVCAYRMNMGLPDRLDFNFCVAKCRVINEHTIGILKNRWFSLKEIKTQLNENKDHARLCKWILTCALLHNWVHECNDRTEEDMAFAPLEPAIEIPRDAAQYRGRSTASVHLGGLLLQSVRRHALLFNRALGGCLNTS